MKRLSMLFGLLISIIVLSFSWSVSAQTLWEAILYSANTGIITRLDANGDILYNELLPVSTSVTGQPPMTIAVSPQGNYILYLDANNTLFLYSAETRAVLLQYPLPANVSAFLGAHPFNFDESRFGVGYINHDTYDQWAMLVFNRADLTLPPTTLTHTDPVVMSAGLEPYRVPVIGQITGDDVYFTMIAIGDSILNPSYIWNMATHTITPTYAYQNAVSSALFTTGEVISATQNMNFAFAPSADAFPMYQLNALEVYDPTIRSYFPFYHDANVSFSMPVFIEDGRRILVGTYDGVSHLRLLGRDGTLFGEWEPTTSAVYRYAGVSDGFLFLAEEDPASARGTDSTTLYAVTTTEALASPFDSTTTELLGRPIYDTPRDETLRILWTSGAITAPTGLVPFQQLAPPISDLMTASVAPTATAIPVFSSSSAIDAATQAIIDRAGCASMEPAVAGELAIEGGTFIANNCYLVSRGQTVLVTWNNGPTTRGTGYLEFATYGELAERQDIVRVDDNLGDGINFSWTVPAYFSDWAEFFVIGYLNDTGENLSSFTRLIFAPIGAESVAPITDSAPTIQCPGAQVSRLAIGDTARVTPGVPNTLRADASTSSTALGSIPGGDMFIVIGGPLCAEGFAWYQVNYNGIIGWTAEGNASEYWVEPIR